MIRGNGRSGSSKSLPRVPRAKYSHPIFVCLLCAALLFVPANRLCAQQAAQPPLIGPQARMAAQVVFNKSCVSCHQNVKASADETAANPRARSARLRVAERLAQGIAA